MWRINLCISHPETVVRRARDLLEDLHFSTYVAPAMLEGILRDEDILICRYIHKLKKIPKSSMPYVEVEPNVPQPPDTRGLRARQDHEYRLRGVYSTAAYEYQDILVCLEELVLRGQSALQIDWEGKVHFL